MATSHSRPGVEVVQELRNVSPTVLRPVLLPVIVGPCYEIIDLMDSSGAVNSTARLTLPARIVGDSDGPTLVVTGASDGTVVVSVGGGADQSYTLPTGTYTFTLAASYLENNLTGLEVSVNEDGDRIILETASKGENQTIELSSTSTALTKLGLIGYADVLIHGMSAYENRRALAPFTAFPVDKGTLGELDYVEDDIRFWLLQGGATRELMPDEAPLYSRIGRNNTRYNPLGVLDKGIISTFPATRYEHTLTAVDDGDGDGVTRTFYAGGENASIELGDLTLEAKGNQDVTNEGPYHGDAGNSITVAIKPSGGATQALQNAKVKVTSLAVELYPDVTLTTVVTGSVAAGEVVQGWSHSTAAEGAEIFTAVVHSVSAATGAVTMVLRNLSDYGALMDMAAEDIIQLTGGVGWTATVSAKVVSTTVAEMATLIDSAAANLLVTDYDTADGTNVFFDAAPTYADQYQVEIDAAIDFAELKPGDAVYLTDEVDMYLSGVTGTPVLGDVLIETPAAAIWTGSAKIAAISAGEAANQYYVTLQRVTDWNGGGGSGLNEGMEDIQNLDGTNFTSGVLGMTSTVDVTFAVPVTPAKGDVVNDGTQINWSGEATIIDATDLGSNVWRLQLGAISAWSEFVVGDTDFQLATGAGYGGGSFSGGATPDASMFSKAAMVTDAFSDHVMLRPYAGSTDHLSAPTTADDLYVYKVGDTGVSLPVAAAGVTMDASAAHRLSGGRDPIDFTAAASAATASSAYPVALGDSNYMAMYIGLSSGAGTSFTVGNFAVFGTFGSAASGKILSVGSTYLIVGFNRGGVARADGGLAGDLLWPRTGDGVSEYDNTLTLVAASGKGTVGEAHYTAEFSTVGAMAVGDTLSFVENGATWTADVVSITALAANSQVVLTDLVRTVAGANNEHGLPTAAAVVDTGTYVLAVGGEGVMPKLVPSSGGTLTLSVNGGDEAEVALVGYETPTQVQAAVNTAISNDANDFLVAGTYFSFSSAGADDTPFTWRANTGMESTVYFKSGMGSILFGTDLDTKVTGGPFKVAKGDKLYNGSTLLGTVTKLPSLLTIGGASFTGGVLTLDTDAATPATEYDSWYIMAANLAEGYGPDSAEYLTGDSAARPFPEISIISATQDAYIRHDCARNFDGTPVDEPAYNLYVSYSALRLDLAPGGDRDVQMQIIEDTTDLEDKLGPIDPDNPLAWGVYRALLNMPDLQCAAIGVGATSADQPQGTTLAHTNAAEFLESENVYMIVPLTWDRTVQQVWMTHVDVMSEPEGKSERILFINRELPDELEPTFVGSGDADTDMLNVIEFDSGDINVVEKLLAAGIDPSWTADDFLAAGVYVDITSDALRYCVSNVNGQKVTVQVSFSPGENDDAFYSEENMPDLTSGGELCSINMRGDAVESSLEICTTLSEQAEAISERRVRFVMPDYVLGEYNGVQQEEEGYYGCCAIAGQRVVYGPSRPLKNIRITGLTGVKNSSDKFSERNLAVAAGGGIWWMVQDVDGGPVVTRDSLTTDMSSIESREDSIGTALDYLAIMYRIAAKRYIGSRNITPGLLDTLATALEGIGHFAAANDICDGAPTINNIVQDEDQPDTILVDITVRPLYPCNLIRITLVV